MPKFIAATGPDQQTCPEVRFRTSAPDFVKALERKQSIDRELEARGLHSEAVIYRLSFDERANGGAGEFHASRQLDLTGRGDERYDGEPDSANPLAYELFTTPIELLKPTSNPLAEPELREAVEKIYTFSHSGRPTHARP
jgi:hypothetical protein